MDIDAPPSRTVTEDLFLRQVVPVLREIPVAEIAKAVGLSEVYCAKIRSGRGIPSRRHWGAFVRLLSTAPQ
jgi:hypothetical protein